MNMQSQNIIAPTGANAQWQFAHIYPYEGHFARVFWKFSAAMGKGLFSKSRWKQKGRIVPDNQLPAGIVIEDKGISKGGAFVEPVLKVEGEYFTVAINWYSVFSMEQTIPKAKRKTSNNSPSLQLSHKEPSTYGSLETVLQHLWATEPAHALANLLSVFGNRALPQFDARLIGFCQHENARVRWRAFGALEKNTHPLIRHFALKQLESGICDGAVVSLFANNYEPGDEHRILESLKFPPDEGERHSLLMDLNKVLEKNPEADCSKLAVIVYASTPCENCRFFAVRLLHARKVVPEWVREECRYDTGEDCRQLVASATEATET